MISSLIGGTLYDSLPLVPLAIALVWSLRYQNIADFSIAGSFSIAGGVFALCFNSSGHILFALALGTLAGLLVGLIMAFVVNVLHVNPLLASINVLFISYAISLRITQGTIRLTNVPAIDKLRDFDHQQMALHPSENLMYLLLGLLAVVFSEFFLNSEWGSAFRALEDQRGGKIFLSGLSLSAERFSSVGLCVSAFLAATSGLLVTLRDEQTTSSLGLDSLIEVVPAYLLGLALFEGAGKMGKKHDSQNGERRVGPSLAAGLGVVTFFLIINVSLRFVSVEWLPRVVVGGMVIGLLGAPQVITRRRIRHQQFASTTVAELGKPLRISDLSVRFSTLSGGYRDILRGFSIEASPGEIVRLTGENGSGKTTLLRALAGLIECHGNFSIPFRGASGRRFDRLQLIGYFPQDLTEGTVETLTVAEHALLYKRGRRISAVKSWRRSSPDIAWQITFEAARRVPMARVGWLSGGERRTLLLSLLRLREDMPQVLVFDEPFTHLDEMGREVCLNLVRELSQEGRIVLIVDHEGLVERLGANNLRRTDISPIRTDNGAQHLVPVRTELA